MQRDDVLAELDVEEGVGEEGLLEDRATAVGGVGVPCDVPGGKRVNGLVDLVGIADDLIVVEVVRGTRQNATELEAQGEALSAEVLVGGKGVFRARPGWWEFGGVFVKLVVVHVPWRVDIKVQRAEERGKPVVEGCLQVVALYRRPDAPAHLLVEGRDALANVGRLPVHPHRDGVLGHGAGVPPEPLLLYRVDALGQVDQTGDLVVDEPPVLLALTRLELVDSFDPLDGAGVGARDQPLKLLREVLIQATGDAHHGENQGGEGGGPCLGRIPEFGILATKAGNVHDAMDLLKLVQIDGHEGIRLSAAWEQGLEGSIRLAKLVLAVLSALLAVLGVVVDLQRTEPGL